MGVVTIFPGRESIKDVARLLLSLADHPRDIATTLDPGHGFVVSRELFDRFEAAWGQGKDPVAFADSAGAPSIEAGQGESDQVKRKPGRPRRSDKEK